MLEVRTDKISKLDKNIDEVSQKALLDAAKVLSSQLSGRIGSEGSPSLPGHPPGVKTGALKFSFRAMKTVGKAVEVRFKGYGALLHRGTKWIRPRPIFSSKMGRERPSFASVFKAKFQQYMRAVR